MKDREKLKLVTIKQEYCNYLRRFDNKVPYNYDNKKNRPFIGVLFEINDCFYFAPLTSPKPKHQIMKNTIDFYLLNNGKLGAINFNNMIPVTMNNINILNFNEIKEKEYNSLLLEQFRYLTRHDEIIYKLSRRLYMLYKNNRLAKNVAKRCCNFLLLEEKCTEYNKICL